MGVGSLDATARRGPEGGGITSCCKLAELRTQDASEEVTTGGYQARAVAAAT